MISNSPDIEFSLSIDNEIPYDTASRLILNRVWTDEGEIKKDSNVIFNDIIDSNITYKKWFFGHWHSDWGYENYSLSKYIPLYRMGIVLPE